MQAAGLSDLFHGLIAIRCEIMKPDQIYQALKELAEKLEVTVSEQNLRSTGVRARSGLCKIKGKYVFVMDKHKAVSKKIDLLAECLSRMPHEDIYILPAVRERLDLYPKT